MFDSNIWLAILEGHYHENYFNAYIRFFDRIVDHNNGARIAVPALMLSEIINRILRDIYFQEFIAQNGLDPKTAKFKRDYRHTPDYARDFEAICADIRSRHQYMVFVSDKLSDYTCKKILKNIPPTLDFNDFLMAKICQDQGITMVTHDNDFAIEDMDILTKLQSLLNRMLPPQTP